MLPVADTFAYCLLKNHFHLLVRIKTIVDHQQPQTRNPSQQFGHLFNAYSKAINKAYGRTGSLFEHPFERIEVASEPYLVQLITYIHRNPQRHGMIADFRDWPYSSYHALCSTRSTRLQRDEVLAWFDGPVQFVAAHQRPTDAPHLAALGSEDFE